MEDRIIRWQTEFKKGYAKPCVLYVLSKGDYHAYRVRKEVQQLTEGQIVIAGSNIYPMLRGLAKEELIERFEKDEQKLYKITPTGRNFLERILVDLREFLEVFQQIATKER
ncbi:MAG: PadR family transcriptional regulator [Candidatus Heimdallarchaeota archaeon]